jgi:hypothetical protein
MLGTNGGHASSWNGVSYLLARSLGLCGTLLGLCGSRDMVDGFAYICGYDGDGNDGAVEVYMNPEDEETNVLLSGGRPATTRRIRDML